jgi:hypothetical protein
MNFIIILISLFYCVSSRESYLIIRNNFLKYSLKLQNYRLNKIINNIGYKLHTMHCASLDKLYNISYKYYTLTYDEKELLEGILFLL